MRQTVINQHNVWLVINVVPERLVGPILYTYIFDIINGHRALPAFNRRPLGAGRKLRSVEEKNREPNKNKEIGRI